MASPINPNLNSIPTPFIENANYIDLLSHYLGGPEKDYLGGIKSLCFLFRGKKLEGESYSEACKKACAMADLLSARITCRTLLNAQKKQLSISLGAYSEDLRRICWYTLHSASPLTSIYSLSLTAIDLSIRKIAFEKIGQCFPNLKDLSLCHTPVTDYRDKTYDRILNEQAVSLSNLKSLTLIGNELSEDEMELIATSPQFSNLTRLNVSHNLIGVDGLRNLLESSSLQNLIEIIAHEILISSNQSFGAYDYMEEIKESNKNEANQMAEEIAEVSESNPKLRKLDLSSNWISQIGKEALENASNLKQMDILLTFYEMSSNSFVPNERLNIIRQRDAIDLIE